MIELLGSIGWGLLACGSITHVWHHHQLRRLLGMHLDHERVPAVALTAIEVALTVGIAGAYVAGLAALRWLSLAAFVLALGFMIWIARLLLTQSDLPCACSFSEAPTSIWSLGRAVCVGLVGAFAFVGTSTGGAHRSLSEQVAVLLVGWAISAALFVLPEALSWPPASRALLARVEAHVATTGMSSPSSSGGSS